MAKIITIAQQKGGAGKSTVAAHIAIALSQCGNRVTLIDIDPQGSLTFWNKIREDKFGKGYTGINFVSISGWRVGSSVSQHKENADFIIIDSPPHTETEAKSAIREADIVIVPMQPTPTDLWATKATIDFAKSENKLVKVLLNRHNPNSKLSREIKSQLNDAMENFFGNRVLFSSCLMHGKCVTETDPLSQAACEVKSTIEELLGLFAPEK
ncbi:MAG: ParA family protein [Rickettsiaceae bacterium]|nr:ParA family protein [Rickettsiaceae bacterium]